MTDNQGEKLRIYVKASQKTDAEFSKMVGISNKTLYNWYNTFEFTPNQLQKLLNAGIDLDNFNITTQKEVIRLGVPIYDIDVTAGIDSFCDMDNGVIQGHITHPNYKALDGFVRVSGDSMEPEFKSGDYVGFKRIDDIDFLQYGQTYIIENTSNQRMLKVIRKGSKEGYVTIHSLNLKYEDFEVPVKKIKNIYIVLAKIGGF